MESSENIGFWLGGHPESKLSSRRRAEEGLQADSSDLCILQMQVDFAQLDCNRVAHSMYRLDECVRITFKVACDLISRLDQVILLAAAVFYLLCRASATGWT